MHVYNCFFSILHSEFPKQGFSWLSELEGFFGPSELTVTRVFILYQFDISFMNSFILLAFNTSSGNEFHKIIMHVMIKTLPSVSFKLAISQFHWAYAILVMWEAMYNCVLVTFFIPFTIYRSLFQWLSFRNMSPCHPFSFFIMYKLLCNSNNPLPLLILIFPFCKSLMRATHSFEISTSIPHTAEWPFCVILTAFRIFCSTTFTLSSLLWLPVSMVLMFSKKRPW